MSATDYNSRQPVRTEADGDVVVFLADPTTPSQRLAIDSSGRPSVKLDDGAGNAVTSQLNGSQHALDIGINVAGVQIDPRQIRALTVADIVTAAQGAAAAISGAWPVKPTDGTNSQSYTAAGEAKVSVTQPLPAGTNIIGSVKLDDGAGNAVTSQANGAQRALDVGIDVAGVQIDPRQIRALTASDVVQANIKDASGAAFSSTNPLPVLISATVPGTAVNNYFVSTANVAAGSSDIHLYTITATKTFLGKKWIMSSSGRARFDIQVSTNGTTFTTVATVWTTSSCPTVQVDMGQLAVPDSGTGAAVQIVRYNEDKQGFGLFSTICGVEQ